MTSRLKIPQGSRPLREKGKKTEGRANHIATARALEKRGRVRVVRLIKGRGQRSTVRKNIGETSIRFKRKTRGVQQGAVWERRRGNGKRRKDSKKIVEIHKKEGRA